MIIPITLILFIVIINILKYFIGFLAGKFQNIYLQVLYSNWSFVSKTSFYLLSALPITNDISTVTNNFLDTQMLLMELPFNHCSNYQFGIAAGFYEPATGPFPMRPVDEVLQWLPLMSPMKTLELTATKRPLFDHEGQSYINRRAFLGDKLTEQEYYFLWNNF